MTCRHCHCARCRHPASRPLRLLQRKGERVGTSLQPGSTPKLHVTSGRFPDSAPNPYRWSPPFPRQHGRLPAAGTAQPLAWGAPEGHGPRLGADVAVSPFSLRASLLSSAPLPTLPLRLLVTLSWH